MSNFNDLINHLLAKYPDEHARGKEFESVCKWFLENDVYYGQVFAQVWLWDDWPGRWGPDTGIDLVGATDDGKLVAIQAKCHSDTVPISEIDRFVAASGRSEFAERLLIATSRITRNTEKTLANQEMPSPFLLGARLADRDIDWLAYLDDSRPLRPKPKKPFPYQQTVLDDVYRGFQSHDRGKVIMACGTGKTLIGLWASERLEARLDLTSLAGRDG